MCFCCEPCCLIIGCMNSNITISTPEGYPTPPDKVLCPRCGEIEHAVYKKSVRTCGICFIPCCPCGSSDPYLACSVCSFPLGGVSTEKCSSCGVSTTYNAEYCPNCGNSRPGTRSARNTYSSIHKNNSTSDGNKTDQEDDSHSNKNHKDDAEGKSKTIRDMHNKKD